ncbi:aminoglycoside 6-adenylyltransferase [Photorhabdus australis]|uniref:aminoglycoside 6-adenylyltransferase n=1 Tax=Photorhabdus australis TaxID=286156 RepID=UPI00055D85C6|nr:aminoglycoside 6-adenylyltransferase [Photorhabdus australis]
MEDPVILLEKILTFAHNDPRIDTVIQTGSRARNARVDKFSDLDIELIGSGTDELIGNDLWFKQLGDIMVALHLANEKEDEPDWPTCLVVFNGGRKVDFTLASVKRLKDMKQRGLDELYQRGYKVLLDKTGVTNGLPEITHQLTKSHIPLSVEFNKNLREFWFEATQVPVYIARGDLWPARMRDNEMKELLLAMMEWYVSIKSDGKADVWYNGHHLHEWLPEKFSKHIQGIFGSYGKEEAIRALLKTTELYTEISTEVAEMKGFEFDSELPSKVRKHIVQVCYG